MSCDPEPTNGGGPLPGPYPVVDKPHLALVAFTYAGVLAFAVSAIILAGSRGGVPAARYVAYAGIVPMCLGFMLMGLRGRQRTAALWAIRTDGLLFRAGYLVYVGAFLTIAWGLFWISRNSFDLLTRVDADGQRYMLPEGTLDKSWLVLALMFVWFALLAFDYVYLRYLRDRSNNGNR